MAATRSRIWRCCVISPTCLGVWRHTPRSRPARVDPTPHPRRRPRDRRTQTAPLLPVPHRRPHHHHRPTTHLPTLGHLALDHRPRRRLHTPAHPPPTRLTATRDLNRTTSPPRRAGYRHHTQPHLARPDKPPDPPHHHDTTVTPTSPTLSRLPNSLGYVGWQITTGQQWKDFCVLIDKL